MKKVLRDFIVLPSLVLICLFVILIMASAINYLGSSTGNLFTDVFVLLVVISPFYLVIKFLWGKAEEINVRQHTESHRSS